MGYEPNAKSTSYLNPSIEGLCKYAEIQGDKVLRDITGMMNAYIVAFSKSTNNLSGMLPLHGLAENAKVSRAEGLKRIDRVFGNDYRGEILGHIPVGVYKYPTKQQAEVIYSVYMLLGTIGELIRKSGENDLRRGFLELSQIRTYPMPNFERKASDRLEAEETSEEEEEASFEETQGAENDTISELVDVFESWVNKFPGSSCSPHLLGKVATRMFYASETIITKRRTPQSKQLGVSMHYQIIAFLNSVLVEDAKENLVNVGKLNINNTNFSDKIFLGNVTSLVESRDMLTLSKWILSCPLLLCYLDVRSDVKASLLSFCDGIIDERSFGLSIYSKLVNVDVRPKSNRK